MNKFPTKKEIKKKYNIPTDDFDIQTSLPSESEIKKNPGFFEKLDSIPGYEVWKRKSKIGKLISIILFPATLSGAISFYHPVVDFAYDKGKELVQSIRWPEAGQEIKTIVVLPRKIEFRKAKKLQQLDEYPIGTEIYPVSGTMTLG